MKFIFSHSALREGWDNPNVFQICTLNETRSSIKKRQEIGRGLRLPVNQDGDRVFDDNINKLTIIANESYEDFAKNLQNEYESDCGITFGKIAVYAFSKISRIIENKEVFVGRENSEKIYVELNQKGFIDNSGKILATFTPAEKGFSLNLTKEFKSIENDIITVLQSYQIERHIKKDETPRKLNFKTTKQLREQDLDSEFEILWNKIKPRTTFQVWYSTETLINNSLAIIKKMEKIEPVKISYKEGQLEIDRKGITTHETRANLTSMNHTGPLPDIIANIQKETELTRKTIVEILTKSGRISEFILNPQKYMDAVVSIINNELHKLMIDGIKYEKIADLEWSMQLFRDEEILSYLSNRLDVKKSVYDAIVYDSEIERKFAEELDKRDDIKLFVKLPAWFKIETPIGDYNPDWAIVKHGETTIYLVRETKGTKDFMKLRNSEVDKVKCGKQHFKALDLDLQVITSASEI